MFKASNPNFVELYEAKEIDLIEKNMHKVVIEKDNKGKQIMNAIENEIVLIMEYTPYGNLK